MSDSAIAFVNRWSHPSLRSSSDDGRRGTLAGHRAGTLVREVAPSLAVPGAIAYTAYLPHDYHRGTAHYPTLYLLHGRDETMHSWAQHVIADLDALIADGRVPPMIVVMPDAPWAGRGNWYVDSQHIGPEHPGVAAETALTRDLVRHVDRRYRTLADRSARAVGGYSMGGAGALRYVLAHQHVFSAALVLSPAVYTPLPPADSSVRDYGAFGVGPARFVDARYLQLNYPVLLAHVHPALPVHVFLAVGDQEYVNPDPVDAGHDLSFETAVAYHRLIRTPGVTARWRVLAGGHDWQVWRPAFVEGVRDVMAHLATHGPAGAEAVPGDG